MCVAFCFGVRARVGDEAAAKVERDGEVEGVRERQGQREEGRSVSAVRSSNERARLERSSRVPVGRRARSTLS